MTFTPRAVFSLWQGTPPRRQGSPDGGYAGLDCAGPPLPYRPRRARRLTFLSGGVCCVACFFWSRPVRRPVRLRLFGSLRLCPLPCLVPVWLRPAPVAVPCRPPLVARHARPPGLRYWPASRRRGYSPVRPALARLPSVLCLRAGSRCWSRLVVVRAAVVRVPLGSAVGRLPCVLVCAGPAPLGGFFFAAAGRGPFWGGGQGACRPAGASTGVFFLKKTSLSFGFLYCMNARDVRTHSTFNRASTSDKTP